MVHIGKADDYKFNLIKLINLIKTEICPLKEPKAMISPGTLE